jgi:hypothetical protein
MQIDHPIAPHWLLHTMRHSVVKNKPSALTLAITHNGMQRPNFPRTHHPVAHTLAVTHNAAQGEAKPIALTLAITHNGTQWTNFPRTHHPVAHTLAVTHNAAQGPSPSDVFSTSTRLRRTRVRVFPCIPDEG